MIQCFGMSYKYTLEGFFVFGHRPFALCPQWHSSKQLGRQCFLLLPLTSDNLLPRIPRSFSPISTANSGFVETGNS
jgi:hypothetical protein